MNKTSRKCWRVAAKALSTLGMSLFVGGFVGLIGLQAYFNVHRPKAPQPEIGWTTKLRWTHPVSYGTAREASLLIGAFWLAFSAFGLAAAGWCLRIYVLREDLDRPPTGTPYTGRLDH